MNGWDERSECEPKVVALLGPTNTGKTHRAIERMLDFDDDIMGLPLRLLAREVCDKVSARIGEQAVALVTGEEKRVPTGRTDIEGDVRVRLSLSAEEAASLVRALPQKPRKPRAGSRS